MNIRNIIIIIVLASITISFSVAARAMGQRHKSVNQVRYSCPMHPEQVSDKPGACPICGMALIKKENKAVHQKPTCSCCGMKK